MEKIFFNFLIYADIVRPCKIIKKGRQTIVTAETYMGNDSRSCIHIGEASHG